MAVYRIGSDLVNSERPDFDTLLTSAYKAHQRPLCMCNGEPGSPMYIACINGTYYIKRMPNTGIHHTVGCTSWEMPAELSGSNELNGSGITYDGDEVHLRLDFPLAKVGSRNQPAPGPGSDEQKESVNGGGKRLTLRGFLRFLWDEAGLTKWQSSDSKRTWSYVHHNLTLAADHKTVKQTDLARVLFVPEPYSIERKEKIGERRLSRISQIASVDGKQTHKFMLLIAEVKEVQEAGIGYRIVFVHLPDFPFIANDKLHKRMITNFANEIAAFMVNDKRHLIMAATFCVLPGGIASLEEVSLMLTNEQWIPFDGIYEEMLLDKLVETHRSFIRPLRISAHGAPMPSLLLTDAGPSPVAMYVVDGDSEQERVEKDAKAAVYPYWIWNWKTQITVPALPLRQREGMTQTKAAPSPQPSPSAPIAV